MKKKLILFNYSLLGAILFAVLFQSGHSFEHLVKQLTTEHCHHKYNKDKTEFSHAHNDFEDCFVCEYSFSNYLPTEFYSFEFKSFVVNSILVFGHKDTEINSCSAVFYLRGPPINV